MYDHEQYCVLNGHTFMDTDIIQTDYFLNAGYNNCYMFRRHNVVASFRKKIIIFF
jgi:hypothetical protein